MKIYQTVQKLLVEDIQTDTQAGDMISLLSFLEGRLKNSPTTHVWRLRGMYSSYSFTTSAIDADQWLASRPGRALPPGKGITVPTV
jgi:hypothetical protein